MPLTDNNDNWTLVSRRKISLDNSLNVDFPVTEKGPIDIVSAHMSDIGSHAIDGCGPPNGPIGK